MKKIIQLSFIAVSILGFCNSIESQTISDHFFGVNAWMSDTIGDANNCPTPPCIKNGDLHKHWNDVKESGAVLIRYGGITPDKNKPTMFQYLRIIDSVRSKGMEPIIQVPFWNYRYTTLQAAEIVNYINVINGRNVKYWIIGNEPNLSYGYTTAAQVAAYYKSFASAMKTIDSSILIIGPEISSFNKTIIDGLTDPGGSSDITGKDSAGRYYIDVFSFHTYPMGNGTSTRASAVTKLTATGSFYENLNYLKDRVSACNNYHNRIGTQILKMAVTETNVNYKNSSTDNLWGIGANSFFGGQFMAEIFGIGLKTGVDFINLWSVVEGDNSILDNCGYIDPNTGNKKPLFYHFKMMAENFKGSSINCTDNQTNVKVFSCQDGSETVVMILNQDLSNNYKYALRLDSETITSNELLKINVPVGINIIYNEEIENQSSVILRFDPSGTLKQKTEYSLSGHAIANLPPSVVTPECNVPVGLDASSITSTTATIYWTSNGSSSYKVRYKTSSSPIWITSVVSANYKTLTGLTPSSLYEFQVSNICSNISSSFYSGSKTFTTPVGLTVSITSPSNNSNYSANSSITITANASTTSGYITKVEFFQGSTKIGEDLTKPYSYTWNNVKVGYYALKVKATDSGNRTETSSTINVNVQSCPSATITPGGPTTVCSGSVLLKANTGSGYFYQWKKNGTDINGATSSTFLATSSGEYQLKLIQGPCISWASKITVKIQSGLYAAITPAGSTTFCNGGNVKLYANTCSGNTYQWKKNNVEISGAKGTTYTATSSGSYLVKVTRNSASAYSPAVKVTVNSCREISDTTNQDQDPEADISLLNDPALSTASFSNFISADSSQDFQLKVFPNPNNGLFTILIHIPILKEEKVLLKMINVLGQEVYNKEFITNSNFIRETVELDGSLKTGVYTLQILIEDKTETVSVVLAR